MLEKFTLEEIEQIKRELKECSSKSKKDFFCKQQIDRVEEAFLENRANVHGVCIYADIKGALFTLCDHMTSNYDINRRRTAIRGETEYKRSAFVPDEMQEVYRETFEKLVNFVIENKLPLKLPQKAKAE